MRDFLIPMKYAIVLALSLLTVSCDKTDDTVDKPSPEGVWVGEMLMPSGEINKDTLRLQGNIYSNRLYNVVRGEDRSSLGHAGSYSYNDEKIVFNPDSICEGLLLFPNDSLKWSAKGTDRYNEYVGTFGGETFSSFYHLEGDHLILKTDIDNDGRYSLVREVTTYTKVD